jgi:hypothetical protein
MGGIQDKIISLDLEKVKEIQLLETGDILQKLLSYNQCCRSESGSTCFWASWIRILLPPSKNSKKNLDSYCFVTSF